MSNFVTGANGHLGNNVVRHLLAAGVPAVARVRDLGNTAPFAGLRVERRFADLLDKPSLLAALRGIDTLYQVGAVFKRWAKNPRRDIIEPNLLGTRNALEAAAEAGVKKIVYVSSLSALDPARPFDGTTWNPIGPDNPYTYSKMAAERLAHELAARMGLDVSFVLPGAILGPHFFALTPTLELFAGIYRKQLPFAPPFRLLVVDGRDVAAACYAAALTGRPGARYVVADEIPVAVADLFAQACRQFPAAGFRTPGPPPKALFFTLARVGDLLSRFTGRPPTITLADAREFWGSQPRIDLALARRDLAWTPRPLAATLQDTFAYLTTEFGLAAQ